MEGDQQKLIHRLLRCRPGRSDKMVVAEEEEGVGEEVVVAEVAVVAAGEEEVGVEEVAVVVVAGEEAVVSKGGEIMVEGEGTVGEVGMENHTVVGEEATGDTDAFNGHMIMPLRDAFCILGTWCLNCVGPLN